MTVAYGFARAAFSACVLARWLATALIEYQVLRLDGDQ